MALSLQDVRADLHDGYVEIGRVARAEPVISDPERRRTLWAWCEAEVTPGPAEAG